MLKVKAFPNSSKFLDESKVKVDPDEIFESNNPDMMKTNQTLEAPPKIKSSPKKSGDIQTFSTLVQSRIKLALENKTLAYLTEQKYKYSEMDKISKIIYSKKGLKHMKDNGIFPDEINWYIRPENEDFFNILLQDILEMMPKNESQNKNSLEIENDNSKLNLDGHYNTPKNLIKSLNSTCGRHEPNQMSVLWGIPLNELLAKIESENIVFPCRQMDHCGICRIILDQPLFPEDKPLRFLNNALFSIGKYSQYGPENLKKSRQKKLVRSNK